MIKQVARTCKPKEVIILRNAFLDNGNVILSHKGK